MDLANTGFSKKDDKIAIISVAEMDSDDLIDNTKVPNSFKPNEKYSTHINTNYSTNTRPDSSGINTISNKFNEDSIFQDDTSPKSAQEREHWSGRLDFLVSSLGYAVGLGNVWRFPYMCYRNGGGAFLLPYLIFLVLVGMPLFLIDVSLGQFTSSGPFTCWEYAPLFIGIGYSMVAISAMVSIYYNMIIAYSLYYFFASMAYPLPWVGCNNPWNTPECKDCVSNATVCYGNDTKVLPAQEYFNRRVLNISSSISQIGEVQWQLALCLFASWIIVFLCLIKGIKSSGKVVYFTALFPYVVLLILFIRGILLEGADVGIKFYIIPNVTKLADASVWKDAANQIFFSLSASWGGLITLASYNKFNHNIVRDTIIISLSNSATSIFAGFVIFSFLGHLATTMKVNVSDVADKGMGLAFVVYPEAVSIMPGSPFWSLLFFFMLFLLGLDSQFATIETVITGFVDTYPFYLRPRKTWFILLFCIIFFLLGLPLTTTSGPYWLQLMDTYCGGWAVLLIGIFEVISIGWIYGRPGWRLSNRMRFVSDIETMTRNSLSVWWRICWQYITPIFMAIIIIFSWLDYKRATYDNRPYPLWADFLGWMMTLTSLIYIPIVIIYLIRREKSINPYHTFKRILSDLTVPTYKWGPHLPKNRLLAAQKLENPQDYYIDIPKRIKYTDYLNLSNQNKSNNQGF